MAPATSAAGHPAGTAPALPRPDSHRASIRLMATIQQPTARARTRNDLPKEVRDRMVGLLNARLADCIDLQTQTKQAHWNVRGPSFWALHKLFDKINEAVEEYVDSIAERAAQLGGPVQGTARQVAARSELSEYPHEIKGGRAHVQAMAAVLAEFGKRVRAAIEECEEDDADTADIFTEVSRGIDQWLWFVEAHLQAED